MFKKSLLLILSTLGFEAVALATAGGSYYCHTDGMVEYEGYKKVYIQTIGCKDAETGVFADSAEEQSKQYCADWAQKIGIKDYKIKLHTMFTVGDEESYISVCHQESGKNFDQLDEQHMNKVSDSQTVFGHAYLDEGYVTYFYLDNFDDQKRLDKEVRSEQAQWIKRNGKFYCGFIDLDVAFYYDKAGMEVIHPSTNESTLFAKTKNGLVATKKLSGIDANILEYSVERYGPRNITFYNDKTLWGYYDIFYVDDWNTCQ